MSRVYDNWEKLVAAVLKKQQIWELCHQHSRSPSVLSEASDLSSSFDASSSFNNVSFDFSFPGGSSSSFQQQNVGNVANSRNLRTVCFYDPWRVFDLEDMLSASIALLGKGTFGSAYAAKMDNGMIIVVKRLKFVDVSEQDFKRHMEIVGNVRHSNVAALRGYLTFKDEHFLIYDYFIGGSVSELLHGKIGKTWTHMHWETRLGIATGVARGISHIHTQNGGKLVHGNIKASNIFLDSENCGIVSDLGLANMIATTFAQTARCYAPEVKNTQKLSQASDVYSFGILLLELLTRKSPVESLNGHEPVDLVKWVNSFNREERNIKVFDEELSTNPITREQIVSMLKIGLSCVAKSPKKRPKMSTVVKMIEGITIMKNTENQHSIKTERTKLVFFGDINHTFDLEYLLNATAEVLGKGTFGNSYKARLENGITIYVKRLRDVVVTRKEFEHLVEVIGRIRHENVAELRAFYYSKDEKILLYEYYSQGSVSAMLHGYNRRSGRLRLDWKTRLKIALGAARGIAHIHTINDEKLVHGNIKASNIFLNEHQYGLVSDVGLTNMTSQITFPFIQSAGYCAPEVTDSMKLSQASDVYSFGVLLLELVSGKSPEDISIVSVNRMEWTAEVIDLELLRYEEGEDEMVKLMQIGMDCVAEDPESRPKMTDVVKMLEEINGSESEIDSEPAIESIERSIGHVDTMKRWLNWVQDLVFLT